MKPLRTGLGVGLLAGGVTAASKLVRDWRAGALDRGDDTRVLTGAVVTGAGRTITAGQPRSLGTGHARRLGRADVDGKVSVRTSRSARRAAANRPAWVVAPAPGGSIARPAGSSRPAPPGPRKLPSLVPRTPVSAKTMGATVGKFAVKRAGKALGNVAAEHVGKVIEVIETLEKVVASVSEPTTTPDRTSTGPGAAISPPAAVVVSPTVNRLDPSPGTAAGSRPEPRPKPQGTLVSVRKFERGPRVVVGPGVSPPPAPEASGEAAADAVVEAAVEAVADAVEQAVEKATVAPPSTAVEAAQGPPVAKKAAARKAADKAPADKAPADKAPANKPVAAKRPVDKGPAMKRTGAKKSPAGAKAGTGRAPKAAPSAAADDPSPPPAGDPRP